MHPPALAPAVATFATFPMASVMVKTGFARVPEERKWATWPFDMFMTTFRFLREGQIDSTGWSVGKLLLLIRQKQY